MSTDDKKFEEFDTLMVYLNESENQKLTDEILSSETGCKQLESLQKDMQTIEDNINEYSIDEDYGIELWNKISNKLEQSPQLTWFQKLLLHIQQPRFSAVGLVAMFTVAISFYFLGQNRATIDNVILQASNQQLLAQNVQLHLSQTDMFLTQISNMQSQNNSPVMVQAAQSLLASNRIYKNAYANNNNKRLQNLLTELEQVLMEVSNGDTQNQQKYIQDYANDGLLFRVKSTNQQLKSQLSTQQTPVSI